ncbi:uncharacterized protein LOC123538515 [Mercenaria mercenaria]|uniref:uncharacterized protein LOC123538515 n=1 Tax=Mercenaria mercenaria TaxID=6596 RepID=UPI001E1DC09E|nr:uncharacterized protein LOC123538515 [Mercenaria mercenaria]
MEVSSIIVIFSMLLGHTVGISKKVYYMDSALDCGYIGSQTIESGQSVTVNAKEKDTSSSSQTTGIHDPAAVGLVIGIIGSIFGVKFIAPCVGICCFRKYRARLWPFAFEHKKK